MAEKKNKDITVEIKEEDIKFSKERLLQSRKLNVNILSVVLEDGEEYTLSEVADMIEEFKNRKVE